MKKGLLTGGIGSGKSTVGSIFNALNIPVYNSDQEAKKLMMQNELVKKKIIQAFGEQSYVEGDLNTGFLAKSVFGNLDQLQILNDIVHPAVFEHFLKWAENFQAPYVLQESALISNLGHYYTPDFVIYVFAPETIRIQRTVQRDKRREREIKQRIKAQASDDLFRKIATYIVDNDGNHSVIPQVFEIHQKIIKTSVKASV
ncbi:MAG TPA: dephospho-CoA kinase [Saprospiraceae bacterium]|nr:dephospho-CoA kinase [Saprospiraceae bacterium]